MKKYEEIEVKFLDVKPDIIQARLKKIGAKKVGEFFYRRRVFDYPDLRLDKQGAWIRVRDEGDKITLNFKRRLGIKTHDGTTSDEGMEEVEVIVSDFDKTCLLLIKMGFIEKFYIENKRIRWIKDDVEFDIDIWPKLNPYLEIEASNWKKINKAIKLLGLNPKDQKIFSTHQIYKLRGIDELDYKRITFRGLLERKEKLRKK